MESLSVPFVILYKELSENATYTLIFFVIFSFVINMQLIYLYVLLVHTMIKAIVMW